MNASEVAPGIPVFHRANPGRLGILTGEIQETMFTMAQVDWGHVREFVDVSMLQRRDIAAQASMEVDVQQGRYGTVDDLRRRMTFEKLRGMLTDVFYSMKTSEIEFYAHQFRPVLRFIESATNRLLIADEVGLGKTIETGLIWQEWQARERARRLLIVCPPMLKQKWIRELQDRFQIAAEETDARHLLTLLDRFERRGPGLSFALVTSYHSLRPRELERRQLQDLQDEVDAEVTGEDKRWTPRVQLLHRIRKQGAEARDTGGAHFLDLVAFDEAHSMRNTASASYIMGEILSDAANAAVCLSATPIHNQSRDLYALLRLIDRNVFQDEFVFDLLRDRNGPVVQLQNALASTTWMPSEIEPLVARLPEPRDRERIFTALGEFDGSPQSRVEIRHLVEGMNLLTQFVNRTRKRDVIENRVIRKPVTLPVSLTDDEFKLYNTVLALVRQNVRRRGGDITSFHLIHPALRMSSSLPVIAAEVRDGRWGDLEELEAISDGYFDQGDVDDGGDELPVPQDVSALIAHDFERGDSKYQSLLSALRLIDENKPLRGDDGGEVRVEPNEKIVLFAFFKATIAYLERRLNADGFPAVSITGDIKDREERDRLLRDFATDSNRILLCSEIGAEGIDLQFARVLVNYDLPWNPMRVEQRIGRIDRIGQNAKSIVVINFHVKGTIDGSIYTNLYAKIGIFERSIGSLEGILGEEVAKLTTEIFRSDLSLEDIARRAEQTADAICERSKIEAELEESTGALVAFQDLLSEQIGESQRLGRFIKPEELRMHVEDFFGQRYTGADACVIVADNPAFDCLECKLSYRAMSDFEAFCQVNELPWPDGFSITQPVIQITFDPAVHQKQKAKYRKLVLINHLHPFFRWITKENESRNNDWHKVVAVRLPTNEFPAGRYLFLVHRLSMEGLTRKDAFHYAARNVDSGETFVGVRAESLINLSLDRGESLFPRNTPDYSGILHDLKKALGAEIASAQRIFREDQARKHRIRKQQALAHFDRKIASQQKAIATAQMRGQTRSLRGFEQMLINLEARKAEQLAKLGDRAAKITESLSEVSCGLIEVVPA